ncbi:MAG: MoaD/ThiS family protein [Phycisphaeraceae bacterium]|nr:MoaD/ThiS family protein [Phycisphaeraceae bacterium]
MGHPSVEVEVSEPAAASDVLHALRKQWPELKGARLAVNHSFATGNERIGAKDELALIGMVGGG